jgi:hypothetical protein
MLRTASIFVIDACGGNLPPGNAKSDYRATGRSLREQWLNRQREFQRDLKAAVERIRSLDPKDNFIHALSQHAGGESKFLIDYLRSDRPLAELEREYLAQVLEGVLDRKKRRGRPANSDARVAAMQARVFYRMWQAENKKAGIKDFGHRNAMKDEAARFVIDELEPHSPVPDYETVRELMDRPKPRRDL